MAHVLAAAAATAALAVRSQAQDLVPGADTSHCRSALHIGPVACSPPMPDPLRPGSGPRPDSDPIEAQVDAFLAQYGKPPREAIRALLDPSDANIRAYLRRQQETLALVSFVAARMSALQATGATADAPRPLPGELSAYRQVRVTLVTVPADPQSGAALQALRQLATQVPALQAGVALAGRFSPPQLRRELARIEPPLVATATDPTAVDATILPLVRIEDLRNRRTVAIDARGLTRDALAQVIVAMRRAPSSVDQTNAAAQDDGQRP